MAEKVKRRESNFELLRILCMLGVITNHALQTCFDLHTADFSLANTLRIVVMDISIVAVNCFIFISGYFRIRQSWKGFINLYLQLAFYSILSLIIGCLWGKDFSLSKGLAMIAFPLTENELWFIPVYFGLYLIAPLLNSVIENQNDSKQLRLSIIFLLIIDVYIGYIHQVEGITQNGYHLIHFITLYCIGAALREIKTYTVNWGGYSCSSQSLALVFMR